MIEISNVLQEIKTEKLQDFTRQNGVVCFGGISASKGFAVILFFELLYFYVLIDFVFCANLYTFFVVYDGHGGKRAAHLVVIWSVLMWMVCRRNCDGGGEGGGEEEQRRGCNNGGKQGGFSWKGEGLGSWGVLRSRGSAYGLQSGGFAQGVGGNAGEGNEEHDEDQIGASEDLDPWGPVGTGPFQRSGLGPDPILKNPKPIPPRPVLFISGSGPVPSILGPARAHP